MKKLEEQITVIFENERIKVEEIVSNGVVSASDFWYDNPIDEWVRVTMGEAVLELEDREITLKTGESYYIRAYVRHRVKYTSSECTWLCVYLKI